MIIAFCRKTQWPSFQSSRGSSPPTHCARLACWKNVTINSSLSARSQCPKNVTGINRWLSSRRSLGNSRNPRILSTATHLPSVLDPVILPPTWVTVIVQSVMINQWKRSKVWWHYSPISPKLLSQQYVITRLTKGQAGTPHCTPFPYVAAYPRPKTYLLKWSSGLVGLILFPAQLSKLIWGQLSWTGGQEASQGARGRANVASLQLNTLYNGPPAWESDFHWKAGGKEGENGGKMSAFPGRMLLRRLLTVTPFTSPLLWLRASGWKPLSGAN